MVAVLCFGGATYFLLTRNDSRSASGGEPVPDLGQNLASVVMSEEVTVRVTLPKGIGEDQEFSGSGDADYPNDVAAMTYDFGELLNSAGAFGQLLDFQVVHDGPTTYIEIFGDAPEWVALHPEDAVARDVERLREVILASPLLLPNLLEQLAYEPSTDGVSFEGSLDPGSVDGADAAAQEIFDALSDGLGVTSVGATVEVSDELPTHVVYEYSFPVVAGAENEITVMVEIGLEPGDSPEIEIPSAEHVRDVL